MNPSAVSCSTLHKSFDTQLVVDGVTFDVAPGRILALLGPSGCGKTTTLRLIAGFEQPDSGRIVIDGRIVSGPGHFVPPEQRRAGMVFQDYAIFPHLNVADNVRFGLPRSGRQAARMEEMLALVGLAGLGERMPHELSGGQQQRVALARALAPEPAVLLLDEPFSNLDAALRGAVRQEVRDLLRQSGTTAIFVTHDQEEALFVGDEVAVMRDGRVEQIGPAEMVFHEPRTRFVAEFVGQTDFIPGRVSAAGLETALGTLAAPAAVLPGTAVELALRPDDIQLLADEQGQARVTARQFLGIAYMVSVRLPDGSVVRSWQSHRQPFTPGMAVRASLREGHQPPVFVEGTAVR